MERVVTESAWCCHKVQAVASGEVRAKGFADAGPLGVAKYVDQVQIGCDKRLERAVGRQGFNGAAPVVETLTGTWQADAPLMHAQDLGAKGDLVLIDGSRLATLLALPAEPRASKPSCSRRKRASRNPAEHRRERRMSMTCSVREPEGPGLVRAA